VTVTRVPAVVPLAMMILLVEWACGSRARARPECQAAPDPGGSTRTRERDFRVRVKLLSCQGGPGVRASSATAQPRRIIMISDNVPQ
jgi:hypothetical protein